ncbi:MAG: hypothetical protein H0T42_13060 [Deltaproteobacteria bacterium]|nr:hypothetical protein [Deltaproteobacteria bacterium]
MGRWLAIAVMYIASSATSALAAPAPHALRWVRAPGAESCIDRDALVAAVELRLGHALGDGGAAVRTIDGRVEPSGDGFRATLVVRDERSESIGERDLAATGDCRQLDEKLVLVLSLIVDASAAGEPPPTPPPRVTPPVATPERPWRAGLAVSGTYAIGALPGVALGGDLRVEVAPPRWPVLVASAGGWVPDRVPVAAGTSRFAAVGAGLVACPQVAFGATQVRACGGGELVRVEASGMGFALNRSVVEWVVFARVEAEVVRELTARFGVVAGVGIWIPLIRPRFVYSDGAEVREIYDTPAAAGVVRLGVRVAL